MSSFLSGNMSLICRNCTIWASRVECLIGVDIRENDGNEVVKTHRRDFTVNGHFSPCFRYKLPGLCLAIFVHATPEQFLFNSSKANHPLCTS